MNTDISKSNWQDTFLNCSFKNYLKSSVQHQCVCSHSFSKRLLYFYHVLDIVQGDKDGKGMVSE